MQIEQLRCWSSSRWRMRRVLYHVSGDHIIWFVIQSEALVLSAGAGRVHRAAGSQAGGE